MLMKKHDLDVKGLLWTNKHDQLIIIKNQKQQRSDQSLFELL